MYRRWGAALTPRSLAIWLSLRPGERERSSSFRRLDNELRFRLVGQAQKEAKGGVPFARLKAVSAAGEGRKRVVSLAGAKVT